MATISLNANKINQMPSLIKDVKQAVADYKSELSALNNKTLTINKSICNLDDVISSIQTSTQTQEEKIASLDTFSQNCEDFISEVVRIDGNVADIIKQRKDEFYSEYSFLKPDSEKSVWEKFKDGCKSAIEWCGEHWKLVVTILLVAVAIAVIVVTAGTTLGLIMTIVVGACKGLLAGAIIGGLMGGLSSLASGGSFLEVLEAFENGAFSGALMGAFFGGLNGLGQVLGSACVVLGKLGSLLKIIPHIARFTGIASMSMFGFDLLSWGISLFNPDSSLVALNTELHSSALYNGFQFTVSAIAAFTGGFTTGMQNAVCFVAGTMVLTAAGLVAIENIKAGDEVISTNVETGETGEKTVLKTFINKSSKLAHIFVNGEEIIATPSHLFYNVDKGWIPASSLSCGSVLVMPDTSRAQVERVTLENLEEPVGVYNFEVADWHTYHVGVLGILVHNKCDVNAGKPGSPEWNQAVKAIKEGNGKGINANVETVDQARALIHEARPDLIEYTNKGEYYMRQNKILDGFELHPIELGINKNLPHIKWRNWGLGKSGGSEGHIFIHGK